MTKVSPSSSSNFSHHKYAPRVQVCSTVGRFLYRTHPEHAAYLVSIGATPEWSTKQKRIFRITLAPFDETCRGPASRPHPRMYGTAPPVVLQTLGTQGTQRLATYAFKYFPYHDMHRVKQERAYLPAQERQDLQEE